MESSVLRSGQELGAPKNARNNQLVRMKLTRLNDQDQNIRKGRDHGLAASKGDESQQEEDDPAEESKGPAALKERPSDLRTSDSDAAPSHQKGGH